MSTDSILFFVSLALAITNCTCKYTYVQKREALLFENVQMHPSCKNRDYCFEVDDEEYPHKLIDKLLRGMKLANIDDGSTEDRVSDHSIVTPCKFDYSMEPMYQIKDTNNRIRWVVQKKGVFEQRIRVEWCLNKGKITEDGPIDLKMLASTEQEAFCQEEYLKYRFLVISLDGKRMESVEIGPQSIPVCCRCVIKSNE